MSNRCARLALRPAALVPLARARRGQQRGRVRLQAQLQLQRIAAGDAAGRMHDDAVAYRIPLRIERLLHQQRPAVLASGERGAPARAACTPARAAPARLLRP